MWTDEKIATLLMSAPIKGGEAFFLRTSTGWEQSDSPAPGVCESIRLNHTSLMLWPHTLFYQDVSGWRWFTYQQGSTPESHKQAVYDFLDWYVRST